MRFWLESSSNILINTWGYLVLALTFAGFLFTALDLYKVRTSLLAWWNKQKEFEASVALLNASNYFIAHIIQVGGEGSMLYSLVVSVDEEGGYFLNPPKKFVGVCFNRPIDLMVIMPSEFSSKHGRFVIDSAGPAWNKLAPVSSPDLFHLPLTEMRNECFVKFVKRP